jgi:hypothetical protein
MKTAFAFLGALIAGATLGYLLKPGTPATDPAPAPASSKYRANHLKAQATGNRVEIIEVPGKGPARNQKTSLTNLLNCKLMTSAHRGVRFIISKDWST